jgi:hypothetical protein
LPPYICRQVVYVKGRGEYINFAATGFILFEEGQDVLSLEDGGYDKTDGRGQIIANLEAGEFGCLGGVRGWVTVAKDDSPHTL